MSSVATKLISVEFKVFGRVQGVFFRKYTQKEAVKLNVYGWVKNDSNESLVVGMLEGPKENVSKMKQWLMKTGSPKSRIDRCEFTNEKEINSFTFKMFEIRK